MSSFRAAEALPFGTGKLRWSVDESQDSGTPLLGPRWEAGHLESKFRGGGREAGVLVAFPAAPEAWRAPSWPSQPCAAHPRLQALSSDRSAWLEFREAWRVSSSSLHVILASRFLACARGTDILGPDLITAERAAPSRLPAGHQGSGQHLRLPQLLPRRQHRLELHIIILKMTLANVCFSGIF